LPGYGVGYSRRFEPGRVGETIEYVVLRYEITALFSGVYYLYSICSLYYRGSNDRECLQRERGDVRGQFRSVFTVEGFIFNTNIVQTGGGVL